MSHGSGKVSIRREDLRKVNLIAAAGSIGITFVASIRSDEIFSSHLGRDSIIEIDRVLGNGAVVFEIVNYRVSVALIGNAVDKCNLYGFLCRELN